MKTIALILLLSSVCFAAGPTAPRDAENGDIVLCVGGGAYVFPTTNEPVGKINGWLVEYADIDGYFYTTIDDNIDPELLKTYGIYSIVVDGHFGIPYKDDSYSIGEHAVTAGSVTLEWEDMYPDTIETHVAPPRVADQEPWHPSGTTDGDVLMHNGAGVLEWTTCPVEYINRKPTTENKKESKMGTIHDFGVFVSWGILGAIFLVGVIIELVNFSIRFIQEDNRKPVLIGFVPGCFLGDEPEIVRVIGAFVVVFILSFFGGFLWPVCAPIGTVCLCLYLMRGFVRFQKKIKSALDFKSDKGHVHPEVPE